MTYSKLDALIVNAIDEGRSPLYAFEVCREAERIAIATGRRDFRVIDARLQALRKSGVIAYVKKKEGGPKWIVQK